MLPMKNVNPKKLRTMSTTNTQNFPDFVESRPEPKPVQRLYHGKKIMLWECSVRLEKISGWVDNPRIDLEKKRFLDRSGSQELSQDEIFDIMKNTPEFKLKELRDDIRSNGLRTPLTLSFSGRLLDGNRRFFALRYVLEGMRVDDLNRSDFEVVPAYVLMSEATAEDEENVLVEENFSASRKLEWPDSVKARKVVDAYIKEKSRNPEILEDDLMKILAKRFDWKKSKVKDTIRISEISDEFISFVTGDVDSENPLDGGLGLSQMEAETIAAKSYQYFNEAQKSFNTPLKTEADFKIQFFRWIAQEKFSSFQEVRVAYEIWKSPEACSVIEENRPGVAKDAKTILDYNKRIVHGGVEIEERLKKFSDFVNSLTVEQIRKVPHGVCVALQVALQALDRCVKANGDSNGQ